MMMLDDENYIKRINAFTKNDWKPLLDLIPEIENTTKYGEIKGEERDEDGVAQMPYWIEAPIVSQFHKIVYNLPIIISFDWEAWDEGHNIVKEENFDFNTIDIPTKCKIITAIVRKNRFDEGALISAFESGLILKILKSIKNQIN